MSWMENLTQAGGTLFNAHLDHAVERFSPTAADRVPAAASPAANQSASDQSEKVPKTAGEARNTATVASKLEKISGDWKRLAAYGAAGIAVVGLAIWGLKK